MTERFDANKARLNIEAARRLVEAAAMEACQQVEDKIRAASKTGLRSLSDPFSGLTKVTSDMRSIIRAEFEGRGFTWKHGSDQRDGNWDVVSW